MDPGRKPTLLVVDDDARYRRVLAHLLAPLAEVQICADGETALALAASRSFDWALLDVALPGADGFAVLARLRRLCPATRVVLHSGLPLPDGRQRARAAGAVTLLEKPLDLPALRALLAC